MSLCIVRPFRVVVRGVLDFTVNWCGLFEKLVVICDVDDTGFALTNKPLKILSGQENDDSY
jgi:hypothetical protein